VKKIFPILVCATFFIFLASSTNADETQIFVGKIEKSAPGLKGFAYFWQFTAVSDNGEQKEFYVPRGGTTIIQLNGKPRYGEAPRKGRKIEVQYVVTERGDNKTVAMRYVPDDYKATFETQQPAKQVTAQSGDSFSGKVESVTKCIPKPPYWRVAILKVIVDNGEEMILDTTADTLVFDASGKDIGKSRSVWKLKSGERVKVKYSAGANSGHDKAISIQRLD